MARHRIALRQTALGVAFLTLILISTISAVQADGFAMSAIYTFPRSSGYFLVPIPNYGHPFYVSPYTPPYFSGPYYSGAYTRGSYAVPYGYGRSDMVYAKWSLRHRGYGDPHEYYLFKRGPLLRDKPPYMARGRGSEGPAVDPVKLSWSKGQALSVKWTARAEPVKAVEIDFTDRYNNLLSHQTVADVPFHVKLDVPGGSAYVRVTVRYADGGIASSALPLTDNIGYKK
ncbi:MAG: hypothetical protein Q7T82_18810 [Armatimonadota bacterium]|nr:hypothetical protein [Armatimonadota bacterium]